MQEEKETIIIDIPEKKAYENPQKWQNFRDMYEKKRLENAVRDYLLLQEKGDGVVISIRTCAEKYSIEESIIWKELIDREMVIVIDDGVLECLF